METHPPCFEEEEEDESKENLCNLKLKQQSLTKEEDVSRNLMCNEADVLAKQDTSVLV